MKTRIQMVTPRQAAKWLETNYRNRPISQAYVDELSRALESGNFRTNHQGIAFDREGRLRDGQHRLTAIVQTGISAELQVSTELSEEELQTIDDGRKRTDQHVLVMMGEEDLTPYRIAIAREMFIGGRHLSGDRPALKPSRLELAAFYQSHRDAVAYADGHFRKNKGGATPSYIAAVLGRARYTVEIESLDRFAQVLVTGIPRAGDESIIRLRDYILNARRAKGRNRKLRDDLYAKTETTLRDWLEGTEQLRLFGSRKELFPLPEESLQTDENE